MFAYYTLEKGLPLSSFFSLYSTKAGHLYSFYIWEHDCWALRYSLQAVGRGVEGFCFSKHMCPISHLFGLWGLESVWENFSYALLDLEHWRWCENSKSLRGSVKSGLDILKSRCLFRLWAQPLGVAMYGLCEFCDKKAYFGQVFKVSLGSMVEPKDLLRRAISGLRVGGAMSLENERVT